MKNQLSANTLPLILCCFLSVLTSCEVVGGIFKLGFWAGAIIVILIVAIIVFIVAKLTNSGSKN